jgi:hypothetical protein
MRTEGNFQARFSRRNAIGFNKLYRLTSSFFRYINISIRIFDGNVSCPGLYGGLYGQNLPYKFKNSYGDFWNCNFKKSHRSTGPRSDLRPDSWSWANSGLDSTFGNVETGSFWLTTSGAYANSQYSCVHLSTGNRFHIWEFWATVDEKIRPLSRLRHGSSY